jgi:hypothetical protein
VDIFDDLTVRADGSGVYKYTINMSASKIKINSILALDSIDGKRVPKLPEIKERIEEYRAKLESKEGVSNVKVVSNFTDFIFKISLDFESVSQLQNAVRDIIKEESKDKNDPIFDENWLTWDGKQLVRSIPSFQSPIHKLKPEDQEALKKGKYISVTRFEKPVLKCDHPQSEIAPSKLAVKVETNTFQIASNPHYLKSTITVTN